MLTLISTVLLAGVVHMQVPAAPPKTPPQPPASSDAAGRNLRVFLDCTDCFEEFLRAEVTFVDYVREPTQADVHVLLSSSETASGGREYTFTLIGQGAAAGSTQTVRAASANGDSDDIVRRQLATALRVGLLPHLTRTGVPSRLSVNVALAPEAAAAAAARDPWDHWVFSLGGSASFDAEESSRQTELGAEAGADRITAEWKITLGAEFEHEREEFDIEDEAPIDVERRELDVNTLVVNGLGEHWSVGGTGEFESSTFENTEFAISVAPAIEFNVFPYSAYTRRQLRMLYAVGARHARYYDETLFGLTSETRPQHSLSVTFDQTERWGTLRARTEWSQYLHDLTLSRLEVDGEIAWRIARGFRLSAQITASRIRDQISLPRRGATPEEILLRLREIQSGYELQMAFGGTYSFGSIFSSLVNPRFGR